MNDRNHQQQPTIRLGILCLVAVLATLAFTPSCSNSPPESQNNDFDDSKADDGNSSIPALKCKTNDETPTFFTLGELETLPTALDLGLDEMFILNNQTKSSYVRLDICYNEVTGKAKLARVIFRPMSVSPDQIYTVTTKSKVLGLERAMIGDLKDLQIFVSETAGADKGVLLEGKTYQDANSQEQSLVLAVQAKQTADGYEFQSINLMAGALQEGDPIGKQTCSAPGTEQDMVFVIDTAVFQIKLCTRQGAGETMEYDIVSASVNDSNPAIPENQRKAFAVSGDAIEKSLTPSSDAVKMIYMVNHHNACDSFFLRTPFAEYAATTAAMAGCGTAVLNAPERTIDDTNMNTLVRVTYNLVDWQDGDIGCSHYFLDNGRCNRLPVTDSNTWNYFYTNHQWNAFELSLKDYTIRIDTIAGDQDHPDANMSWGGRPKLVFNFYEVQTLGGSSGAEIASFATWPDPAKPTARDIYCMKLMYVKPDPASYPMTFAALMADFGLSGLSESFTCPELAILQPENNRPGWDGTMGWTADTVCLLSPKTDTGKGPQFVGVYAPFLYSKSSQSFVKPDDWPAENMKVCIDGNVFDLKEKVAP